MTSYTERGLVARILFITVGIPIALIFVTGIAGPGMGDALRQALSHFVSLVPGGFVWGILALTNVVLFFFLRPILGFYFCERGREKTTMEERNAAMRALNNLHPFVFLVAIGGSIVGGLVEVILLPAEAFSPEPLAYEFGRQLSIGLLMGVLVIFNLENVLLPAKKVLIDLKPDVPQRKLSFYTKIMVSLMSLLVFLAFQMFDSGSNYLMFGQAEIPMVDDRFFSGGQLFTTDHSEALKDVLKVQGLRLFLFFVIGFHVLGLIKQQIRGPLGIIREHLHGLNNNSAFEVATIDIVNNDEFKPLFQEINKLIHRQQGELKTSQGRLEDLLENAADAIVSFRSDTTIHLANPAADRMFGYSAKELEAMSMIRLLSLPKEVDDQCCMAPGFLVTYFDSQKVRPFHLKGRRRDGSVFDLEANFSKVQTNDGSWIYTTILRDISTRIEFENSLVLAKRAAEDANQLKSEFLANMSHELRTPLNAVLGFTHLMSDDRNLTDAQKDKLQTINRSGEHLLGLINDILDISKIEAGKFELHEEVFDLHGFVRDLQNMFSLKAKDKNLSLYVEPIGRLPNFVRGDLGKLRQVLINLLGNAVKFTDEGGVSVALGPDDADPKSIRFSISDTGRGIEPADIESIVQPFTQAGTVKHEAGTGLGLAITSRFIQMMGGTLQIESEVGKGSKFSFALPLSEEAQGPETEIQRGRVIGIEGGASPKILVVDDKVHNRLILKEMLERIGFLTSEAADGAESIKRAREFSPDLVFMDIKMPGMDGYEAVAQFKKDPELRRLPVFALTASAFKHDEQRILASGFTGFLAKPFKQRALFDLIARKTDIRFIVEETPDAAVLGHTAADLASLPPADLGRGLSPTQLDELSDALAINDFGSAANLLSQWKQNLHPAVFQALDQGIRSFDESRLTKLLDQIRAAQSGNKAASNAAETHPTGANRS